MAEEKSSKPQLDWDKARKFLFQVNDDLGAAMLGAMNYLGDRLGIFKSLADAGWVTSQELADRAGLNERYIREWLGAVTSAGYVSYDPANKEIHAAARACDGTRARGVAIFHGRLHGDGGA